MILLWVIVGAMSLAAAMILAWPLFDSRRFKNESTFALAVYRDQLAEINQDAVRGTLDETEARAARIEVERRILQLDDSRTSSNARTPAPLLIFAMAVVLPLVGLGLYLKIGSPSMVGQAVTAKMSPTPSTSQTLLTLQAATERQPGDPAAWRALGEGFMADARAGDAATAFAKAIALGDKDAKLQSRYGSALVLGNDGKVDETARSAFSAAIAADPTDPVARFFLALSKKQSGDAEGALADWVSLERDVPADVPWRAELTANIDNLAQNIGKDPAKIRGRVVLPAAIVSAAATATAPDAVSNGLDAADMAAAAQMSDADRLTLIQGMVAKLADKLKSDPSNIPGWMQLARSYTVLARRGDARAAWAKAAALGFGRLDVQLEYAGALLEDAEGAGEGIPPAFAATVSQIRTLAPDNPLGLYYSGVLARSNGDSQSARAVWLKVLALIPEGAPERNSLQRQIDSLAD
jgi:cytochrome c-type biogenesis protein CcmH